MKIADLKIHFNTTLSDYYPTQEIDSFYYILGREFLGLSRLDMALYRDRELSADNVEQMEKALLRLKAQEPIQYIVGATEFFGMPFKVNTNTLIPRPETEELVQFILDTTDSMDRLQRPLEILDIGTGSGCIAVSLAKNIPNAKISGVDISSETLQVAKENASLNQVDVDFFECDILSTQSLPGNYDIIVSNPPYVRELEKKYMLPNVLDYEPEGALFVKDSDPLLFYRKIASLAKLHLKPNGVLFFEINEYLGEDLDGLLQKLGFRKRILKKDVFGKDRMMLCRL